MISPRVWGFHTVRGGIDPGVTDFVPGLLEVQMYGRIMIRGWDLILSGWRWLYEPRDGAPHRAGQYRPGGPPFSSPVCRNCRFMEGFCPGMGPCPSRMWRVLDVSQLPPRAIRLAGGGWEGEARPMGLGLGKRWFESHLPIM